MAHRILELTLISASDLKMVNLFTCMEVYAVASISGDPLTRQCTHTDSYGGRYPTWDDTLRFAVPPTAAAAEAAGAYLHVLLRTERALGDRDVGEVVIPVADLLACAGAHVPRSPQRASYQVRKVHCTEHRGVLSLSYRFGPVIAPVQLLPATKRCDLGVPAYQVIPCYAPPYAYLPAAYQVVPRYPPPYFHTPAPKPASGCGAAAPPPKNAKNSVNFGLGLLGGAIGGWLVGGMSSSETAAYDDGVADGGGVAF